MDGAMLATEGTDDVTAAALMVAEVGPVVFLSRLALWHPLAHTATARAATQNFQAFAQRTLTEES